MEKLVTKFETSKNLTALFPNIKTEFGWFGNESVQVEDDEKWIWLDRTQPYNNMDREHREDIDCQNPIFNAYTVLEMMPFFAQGKNGEHLNDAIRKKLNSGNKLSSFIADPEFYASLIFLFF